MSKNRLALVTGASSGIGQSFAERLAKDGYDLILVARGRERLESLAKALGTAGSNIEVLAADLSHKSGIAAVEARLSAGDVTLLVNNAGFAAYGPFVEMSPDVAEQQIQLHCTAIVRLTRAVLPAMVKRGSGAVINVSSNLAFSSNLRFQRSKRATYTATKAFINAFVQIVAQEIEGTGVKIQALCPGLVRTHFHDDVGGRPPGVAVAEADDIVAASLRGLELGEIVCVPTLPDSAAIQTLHEAERDLFETARVPNIAKRYEK